MGDVQSGAAMEGEHRITRYGQEMGVDVKYGERTWRPVQTVIDLIQNHLDANTTVYEKKLLGLLGVSEYNPADKKQQATITALNGLKYSDDPETANAVYSSLRTGVDGSAPDINSLKDQLDQIHFSVPRMRLKVTANGKTQLVDYDQMRDLPKEWEVVGFRVDDSGSGFDYRLLGMMGASTKKESVGKRGGLGEGLKMSIAHLTRSGAAVKLLSQNEDQLWISKPTTKDGSVVLEGIRREGGVPRTTGSLTDVDFSNATFDPKMRAEVVAALDPRVGEGLGKHILEFRGQEFISVVDSLTELSQLHVPHRRVYVKGLLVEENSNLLLSYNIPEKWAISGRDRKTVQRDVLATHVKAFLRSTENPEIVGQVVSAVNGRSNFLEVQSLDGDLTLDDRRKEIWKGIVEQAFSFKVGEKLFVPDNISVEQRRLAMSHGYSLALIPSEHFKAIDFITKLYDSSVTISFAQFERSRVSAKPLFIGTREEKATLYTPCEPETVEVLDKLKQGFEQLVGSDITPKKRRAVEGLLYEPIDLYGNLGTFGLWKAVPGAVRLSKLRYAKADADHRFEGECVFDYVAGDNILYVKEDALQSNFGNLVDFYVQLSKVVAGSDVYGGDSQGLVTKLAGEAVASLRPEILDSLHISGEVKKEKVQKASTYTADRREYDARWIDLFTYLQLLDTPNITHEEINTALEELRRLKPQQATHRKGFDSEKFLFDLTGTGARNLYYFDGKLYSLDTSSFSLTEVKTASSITGIISPLIEPTKEFNFEKWLPKNKIELGDIIIPKIPKITDIDITSILREPRILPRKPRLESPELALSGFLGLGTSLKPNRLLHPGLDNFWIHSKDVAYLPFRLESGNSLLLTFAKDGKQFQVAVKRRGDKVLATRIEDGKVEFIPKGQLGKFDEGGNSYIRVHNNVLEISPNGSYEVRVERHTPATLVAQVPEQNRGKEFIQSPITLDYGGEVWRDPKRVLLDAVQNHVDAQRGVMPDLVYTVIGPNNQIMRAGKDEVTALSREWRIVGITIADKGGGYTTPYIATLGKGTKTDEDLGKFGEGLKMLAASALRQGINVEFSSRDWTARPASYDQSVKDYETGRTQTFHLLGYSMDWKAEPQIGSQTSFSLLPAGIDQANLAPQEAADLRARLGTESSIGKTWSDWVAVLDPRNQDDYGDRGLDRYVLQGDSKNHTDGIMSVLTSKPGRVYEKGLFIPSEGPHKMIFGYNVDETVIDTRERNHYSQKLLDEYLAEYFSDLTDREVMKRVLETAKADPNAHYYEYKFMRFDKASEVTRALWRVTYHEVFGEDAVLSLRPELQRIEAERYSRDSFGGVMFMDITSNVLNRDLVDAVANEEHLAKRNLQILPQELTSLFARMAYSSQDFWEEIKTADVELSPEDRSQLVGFTTNANALLLLMLESLESSPERRQVLNKVVNQEDLEKRKAQLRGMKAENIRVKHKGFPADGMVNDDNGEAVVYVNQRVLSDPKRLIEIDVHEDAHFLSGQKDYVLDFQRFMMMVALSRFRPSYTASIASIPSIF